jgi:lipopolysaccharide heptosyltransferase I
MKILIIKLSSIGDVIHTLPVLAMIRKQLPEARVGWAVEQKSADILRDNPLIDELIEIDTRALRGRRMIEEILIDAGKQINDLRQHEFDVAIDFQGLLKSALVAKFTRSSRRFGFAKSSLREPASRFMLTDTIETPGRLHVVRKNLALASGALGLDPPENGFEFPIFTSELHRTEAANMAALADGPFVILNPAGGWPTKLWDAGRFGELADRIRERFGLVSIVTTAPGESELAMKVVEASRSQNLVTAEPTLKGFYELARRAELYVGGDTGPTHLALAAGCPVVGIFGPTEWWRNGSLNPDDICVERNDIGCRVDCHRRACDKWICMEISVETVFGAVAQRLGTKSK